ncbi:PAS domain S-box protein [Methylobacterium tardum]|uniref:PAS domain S-box protein n=1 Tax=Methylobacterium tardum TaxID=374432 RepID=UPI0020226F1F|nr:PAS domain S-box protein [Methylobacterium tardum]URD34442.1 PAS domain S-box protein [Methylobacterium tardum]
MLFSAVDKTGLPMILTDPNQDDDPIVFTNRAFLDLTDYGIDEVVGRNCRFLQGPATEPNHVDEIRAALRDNRDLTIEITNHRRDGTPFVNALFIGPVFDGEGRLRYRFGSQIDVTEAHRNRRRLAESEARQRAIFDSASEMAIVVTDAAGKVTDWNVGAERILGWNAEEMRGQTIERIFTPEDRATGRAREEMALVLDEGHAEDMRWHLRKDGGRFYAVGDMTSLRGLDGTHQGFVKAFSDRTQERNAATKEQADAEFMRSVLASSADCIKVLDLDGGLTFMSEGGRKVMEVSDFNHIKGCPWPSFWQGRGNADALAALAAARDGRIGHFQGRADTFLGNAKWWDVQVTPIFGPDGRPERILSVSRDITERRSFEERLATSEAHWRGLFERLSEGFVVGEVVRDTTGRITDWRYVDVNSAWGRLVGIAPADVVGRTVREVIPGVEDAWVDEFADVVETGEPVTFVRQVGTLARWYEGRAFPLGSGRFGVIFMEVTERVQADARRSGLLEFGERLRSAIGTDAIAMAASAILGRVLGVGRVGYGTVGPDGEGFVVEEDWTAPDFPTLAGRYRMDDYGLYAEDLRQGRTVVIGDVREDPRTAASAATLEAVSARTLVNVPIAEKGRTVAVLYVNDDRPRSWGEPEVAFIRQIAELTRQAVERRRAEERQDLLNHELSHRLKNTMAMVVSIAHQTLRSVSERGPVEAFEKRIQALASAHDLLLRKDWTAADLRSVCREVLGTAAEARRFTLDGPDVALGPSAALSASLLLHELATNAAKYGSLSGEEGEVKVRWWIDGDAGEPGLVLRWREHGGPPVVAPTRRGFGSRLIRTGLVGTGEVDVTYHTEGLVAAMRAPLVEVQRL